MTREVTNLETGGSRLAGCDRCGDLRLGQVLAGQRFKNALGAAILVNPV
jgi:hypothetical protein